MNYEIIKITDNFYEISQGFVRCFLFVGAEYALLIDTGIGGDIIRVIRQVTVLPIRLLTTHADGDHTGCDHCFECQYLHPAELSTYEKRKNVHSSPVWEGDIFSVGDRVFEVIHLPGHTPGSIGLLDRKQKILIAGDTVQDRTVYMQGEARNLKAYLASLQKLAWLRDAGAFDTVYASHGTLCLPAAIIDALIDLTEAVLAGGVGCDVVAAPEQMGEDVMEYSKSGVSMYAKRRG